MGGRGASSGISIAGKVYGTEYHTVYKYGNIKFVKQNNESSITAPMETMTKGRVYVTIGKNNRPKIITYYSDDGKRKKQIDIEGRPHQIKDEWVLPHTHKGYEHDENGTYHLSDKEKKMVERVLEIWDNAYR